MNTSMPLFFLVLTVAGCCLAYLAHRNQQWLRAPLGRAGGLAAALLLAAGLACAWQAWAPLTAIFAWLVVQMLAWSLVPFFTLLIPKDRHEP